MEHETITIAKTPRSRPCATPTGAPHSVCSTEQGAGEYHPPAPSCSDYRVGMLVLGPLQVDVHVQHLSDETLANRLWCLLPGGLQLNCIHPELLQRGEQPLVFIAPVEAGGKFRIILLRHQWRAAGVLPGSGGRL